MKVEVRNIFNFIVLPNDGTL